ncbi:DUF4177 domain-containing protein [Lacrimispora sp. NSJ-141]|uniref:DUF4177 domain-containing protein n=1 Tax=Lientehia hominis TaxID=2897778 RepID=A0AAP2RGH6_9FIRM|nr:DUF4177 domain-containing protein [Lientehia hominis]MCD2491481.1 DUF4177 domain-containing protein [Lientehia hominis]
MKEYKYVSISYEMKEVVMASISEHRNVIDEYSDQGYSYVGMIPTELSAASGCIRKIDLIFEKAE